MFALLFRLLLVASCLTAALVLAAVPADEITSLPGWTGKLPSKHYSGFFPTTLDGAAGGGMLHYWLTLSESDPTKDPVVVWLQGGPGCSSLFGLWSERARHGMRMAQLVRNIALLTHAFFACALRRYENGQLHFSGEKDNSTGVPLVVQNDYAWTKRATMLWLEQPVGVGFSYCLNNNCRLEAAISHLHFLDIRQSLHLM